MLPTKQDNVAADSIYERKLDAIGYSINDIVRMTGIGRSSVYEEISADRLRARKLGRRTVILEHDLRAWLDALPAMKPTAAA